MDTIKIEVYGGINLGGGGCGCGCSTCTPVDAKAEFEIVKKNLLEKYTPEQLNINYIDTGGINLSAYPAVEKVIRAGYSFPITVINGTPCLAGVISLDSITEIISEMQCK